MTTAVTTAVTGARTVRVGRTRADRRTWRRRTGTPAFLADASVRRLREDVNASFFLSPPVW